MKRHGRILYKCRRCGSIDRSLSSPDYVTTVSALIVGARDPAASGITARMISLHYCGEGAVGVADVVGGESQSLIDEMVPERTYTVPIETSNGCPHSWGTVGEISHCSLCGSTVRLTKET